MHRYPSFLVVCFLTVLTWCSVGRGQADPAPAEATPGKPMGQLIRLSDFGSDDLAYLAVPNTAPTVGIVMVPDAYGLDAFTKSEADRLAGQGYIVLAVDIYNGHLTTDPGNLSNMIANLSVEPIMKTIDTGIRFFHESPKFHVDHIVTMGWGTGATYVFQTAREDKTIDGAITFYGPIETDQAQVGKFVAPLCALYPQDDPVITRDKVQDFQHMMKVSGNDFEAWFIAAPSGWSNPSSKGYNSVEDREAWKVALPFLVRVGALPVKHAKDSILDKAKAKIESIFK